ncbi:proton-conducting transporter membrane subunit [Zavarzinia aquatilis]|uniref:NADH:quinone oxidoreductase/Mrp antiporter transmembrane domain-containing protein n=1 Tax=Zavarzinia aquatilis TaxID=2211142 RepID=A0A317EFN6_9PROT|nr:proton-conducting transporter membrane subunit [Zavarzinia aquatilis]PWR25561.1 hypothetical protein DKG74_00875 [Zavarzinia aquatilis]
MTEALALDLALLPPGWPLVLAGLLAGLLPIPIAARNVGFLGLLASLWLMFMAGGAPVLEPLDAALAIAFHLVAGAGLMFAAAHEDRIAIAAGLVATGAACAALASRSLAGLMIWTEVIAIASALIVMAGGTQAAIRAGLAYLLLQVLAGVLLLVGIALGSDGTVTAGAFVLLALLIKAAAPPVHGWLIHAYAAASPTGSIFLSAFATKVAVIALARLFPGEPALIWLGLAMAVLAVIPTLFESDWRRLLTWAVVSQLGVMIAGIGLGTAEALDGVRLLAIGHVVYATLLFVVAGALEMRGGKAPAGLRPFALLAALTIGLPGLAGYLGKAVIGEALIDAGLGWADIVIVVVGAVVFATAGLRPLVEKFGTPGGERLSLREGAAALLLVLAGLALGSFGGALSPQAEAAFHATPLIVQGIALAAAALVMLTPVRRLLRQRPGALGALAVPMPSWVIGAVQGFGRVGAALDAIGGAAAGLIGGGGRLVGHAAVGLARYVSIGGVGDGVLWTLTVLTIVLIVSFG